jgi:hypothetical protein
VPLGSEVPRETRRRFSSRLASDSAAQHRLKDGDVVELALKASAQQAANGKKAGVFRPKPSEAGGESRGAYFLYASTLATGIANGSAERHRPSGLS